MSVSGGSSSKKNTATKQDNNNNDQENNKTSFDILEAKKKKDEEKKKRKNQLRKTMVDGSDLQKEHNHLLQNSQEIKFKTVQNDEDQKEFFNTQQKKSP